MNHPNLDQTLRQLRLSGLLQTLPVSRQRLGVRALPRRFERARDVRTSNQPHFFRHPD